MDPILTIIRVGEIERPLGTYGLMMAIAIVVGSAIATRGAYRARMDVGATIAVIGFTVGGALGGATLLFAIVEWIRTGDPLAAVHNGGGLVFYGAPIGGLLALVFSSRKLEISATKLLDVGIVAVPVAHALGRLGCFFGGCCYGRPWEGPWAIRYTHPLAPGSLPSVLRHPTPLYESALLLGLAFALAVWPLKNVGSGLRASVYVVAYGCIRLVTELFRGDAVRGVHAGISTSQMISMLLIIIGTAFFVRANRQRQAFL